MTLTSNTKAVYKALACNLGRIFVPR